MQTEIGDITTYTKNKHKTISSMNHENTFKTSTNRMPSILKRSLKLYFRADVGINDVGITWS